MDKGNERQKSSHESFVDGVLELKDYQPVLLNKIKNAKQKLD